MTLNISFSIIHHQETTSIHIHPPQTYHFSRTGISNMKSFSCFHYFEQYAYNNGFVSCAFHVTVQFLERITFYSIYFRQLFIKKSSQLQKSHNCLLNSKYFFVCKKYYFCSYCRILKLGSFVYSVFHSQSSISRLYTTPTILLLLLCNRFIFSQNNSEENYYLTRVYFVFQ